MSIFNLFKKPNWKNNDESIRASAVAHDTSEELLAQLGSIAQNDSSEKVRTAALKRLRDYRLIAKIARNDKSKLVKNAAFKMMQDWFAKKQDDTQLDLIKTIDDVKSIELAALNSKNKEIRTYCIDKISKQGLLGDLLVNETDRDLRQIIVAKIDKPATLKRVLKLVKNKDKVIIKVIQAKLENDGDIKKINAKKALDLCEAMEKLIHNPSTSSKADVDGIKAKWDELNSKSKMDDFKQRFEGAYRTASLTFDPKQRDEFLNQQRQQRINSKIEELKKSIENAQNSTWEHIQTQISKYSGFDLSHADGKQKDNFENVLAELKALRDTETKEQELPEKLMQVADKLDAALKHKYNQPSQIKEFRQMWDEQAKRAKNNAAFATLKNRFDNAMLKLAERIENSAALRDEAAKNAVQGISKAQKLIKDGQLANAKIAINKIATNKKIAGFHPLIKDNKFAFDSLWNELKELRKWQTWSNDKIRIRIIEELKDLIGKGVHPDALLKKMKEANKRWKDMEDHEKLEGDRYPVRNQELYTQFREVQQALFEPAQKFFEARSEIWGKELEQVQAKVQALHEVDLQETEDRDLARMVREAIKQLRNLDAIPPKARGKIAAQIRSGTARIDAHLQESYKVAVRRKEKLIEQAQALVDVEELDEAIEAAKKLQNDWKHAGIVAQNQERKLWKIFRKANDAVFNRIKQQRDAQNQENKELMNTAADLIKICEKAIKSEKTAQGIHSLIERFKDDYNVLDVRNKSLQTKAMNLIEAAEKKVASLANNEIIDALTNAQKYAAICQNLELGTLDLDKAQENRDKLKQLDDKKLAKQLSQRFAQAQSPNADYSQKAGLILIAAEYLTGQATPDEYKEQRLAYQVDELAKRMGGAESQNETDQAVALLTQWFTLQGADANFIKTNDKRSKKVIKSLFDLLKG